MTVKRGVDREGLEHDIQVLFELAERYQDLLAGGREFSTIAEGAKALVRLREAAEFFSAPKVITDTATRWEGH